MEDGPRKLYDAASSGNLKSVRSIIKSFSKDSSDKIISSQGIVNEIIDGATPLIAACRNGHLPVVVYLVESCQADIEQVGTVQFDGENIEGAPPLWCASAAGHMEIVEYLVRVGAEVNKTTFSSSSPLRAACFDGHLRIVKFLVESKADIELPNKHGHTCLMIACFKTHIEIVQYLLTKKANVNRKSLKGNTALHDCAESGSLEIMKLLLRHKATMEGDTYGNTPLLAAATIGHGHIVEFLITRSVFSKKDKIGALELLGATYVDRRRDLMEAARYWNMSLEEWKDYEGGSLPRPHEPVSAYNYATEFNNAEELSLLVEDPDEMRMQALFIREKILGPIHPDTSYYIRYRGAVYADSGDFARCITLWKYALAMQQEHLDALNQLTQSSFLSFAELFSFMATNPDRLYVRMSSPGEFFDDLLFILNQCIIEIQNGRKHLKNTDDNPRREKELNVYNRYLVIVLHITSLIIKYHHDNHVEEYQLNSFTLTFSRLVSHNFTNDHTKQNLLHLACSKDNSAVGRYPICNFPQPCLILKLLKTGLSPTKTDISGNTALHLAAKSQSAVVIRLLLMHGAHLCMRNHSGQTASDLLTTQHMHHITPTLQHTSLQCLAASVIKKHLLPYQGDIATVLQAFVHLH